MRARTMLLGAAFALLLAAPAVAEDYDCDNIERSVQIFNRSSAEITSLDSYNRDGAGQGDAYNLLDSPLEPGDDVSVNVGDGSGYHIFNLEAFTDDGYGAYTQLNACSYDATWVITDGDLSEEDDE